jgi:PAS domain S-box-containing protein
MKIDPLLGRPTSMRSPPWSMYKAVRAALALAERRFQATFHHAPVGIAHVGLDGGFLLVNARFCEITGYPADVLIHTGFQQITRADDLHADAAMLRAKRAGRNQLVVAAAG